ncbi:MAG: DNA recombination protein RmuC [Bryobacteraceae bacterium]
MAWLWLRGRIEIAEARAVAADESTARAGEAFQGLADQALRSTQGAFLEVARSAVVQPLADTLGKLEAQVRAYEGARNQAFGGLEKQIDTLARETVVLSNALKAPQSRGRWGELTLRRVAELAGMVKFCDFEEQSSSDGSRQRPDMVVHLPGGRTIVVDAKAPLSAFLEASSAKDDAGRKSAMLQHAQQVGRHIEHLSGKQYWAQFQSAPDLVVLFLPGDHFLSAALEANPELLESALDRRVLLATPMTLISILKGVGHGWRQQHVAEGAEQIRKLAHEFHERLAVYAAHYADAGAQLNKAVESYNRSVGSWESRLTPTLRRLRELGVGDETRTPEHLAVVAREPAAERPRMGDLGRPV